MIGLTKMLKDGDASIVSICNQETDGGSVDIASCECMGKLMLSRCDAAISWSA